LVFPAAPIGNQKSKIGNTKTHPLPRDGTDCFAMENFDLKNDQMSNVK
jgi:hypothetical protein